MYSDKGYWSTQCTINNFLFRLARMLILMSKTIRLSYDDSHDTLITHAMFHVRPNFYPPRYSFGSLHVISVIYTKN